MQEGAVRKAQRMVIGRALSSMSQPYLRECENETHTPEMGTWESFGTPKISEFDCRGQNISHWGVFFIIGKLLKCRCWKWLCMDHLDIYSTSYGKKKGRESNWQFHSRLLKVGNRPNPGACKWSVAHRWKALEESYKFSSDLISIGGLSKELWACKARGIQTGIVSGLLLGSPGTKNHSDVGAAEKHKVYYMGEGGGFPQIRVVVNQSESKVTRRRNPTLRELWGRHLHSRKWDLGVLRDSQKFRAWLQGSKHLALKRSLYH